MTMKSTVATSGKDVAGANPASASPAARMGDRIRRARLMAGLSLRGLADALGGEPSHTQLAKFEAGEVCPDS